MTDVTDSARRDWGGIVFQIAMRFLGAVLATCLAVAAVAQVKPEHQPGYDAAFQETLDKPDNLDVLFKFAAIASESGDLEGAVSALERMLLINPALPRVRLELGVLYFRLGSYELSRSYLQSALATSNVPPDVRAKAEQYMAELDKRLTRSRFSGEFFFGLRYQSNANLGPDNSQIRLFGQVANLNQGSLGAADWGAVSTGQVRHVYDLQTQDKAVIESVFTYYANRQFQVQAANVALIDFTTGPRFQLLPEIFDDLAVKPFASVGYIWINDTPYYGSYGAGVETNLAISSKLRNISIFSWRQENYPDTWYLPNNSLFTGVQYAAISTFQYQLSPLVALFAGGNVQRYQTARTPAQNYTVAGTNGGISFRFTDPVFRTTLPWSIGLTLNLQWWQYDQPDPIVDPSVTRYQQDTIASLLFAVPFDERTTFSVALTRFNRAANLPNYAFANNSAMVGVSWRF